jgi:acyl transferase domain-containing protein
MAVVGMLEKKEKLLSLFILWFLLLFIGMGYSEIRDILPPEVEVACRNSSKNCTISGPKEEVVQMVQNLEKNGTFAALLYTDDIAFHSRHMKETGYHYNEIMSAVCQAFSKSRLVYEL